MSSEITTAFKKGFADNFDMLYQQRESKLGMCVRRETQNSEAKFFDFVGETGVQWDPPRHGDTPQIDTPHTRRKVTMHNAVWADKIDKADEVQAITDPTSAYTNAGVAAMHRAKDERILEALGAIAYTGKEGTTAINHYDAGECRVINGIGTLMDPGDIETTSEETGLTLAKIGLIGDLMDDASVPEMGRYIVANSRQKWYLLGSTKATSSDYNTIRALVNGEINSYLGFTFIWLPSDRFTENAVDSGCYDCYGFHRDSVILTTGIDLTTEVDRLPTKNYSVQVFAQMMIGATRLQGPGVVKILLDKDPALDFTLS